jgi:tripartite-type tricarboxylate transporter receptor subunit TctC
MKRLTVILSAVVVVALGVTVFATGCSQSAPAAAPTKAPAAEPTKAAAPASQPTAAVASQPAAATAAPAKKVDFPTKGKAVTLLVPYAAGGPSDVMARLMAPTLQEILGTVVEVVDKPGASSQVGVTELVKAKPDGYTIGQMNLPSGLTVYMDPDRKAVFGRKDLMPLAVVTRAPETILVKADSPFKTLKDLVEAAKANPGKVSLGATGYMGTPHLAALQFAKQAGVQFGVVQFDGSAPAITALQGGHVECVVGNVDPPYIAAVKGGNARSLGVMDSKENSYLPGVKTFEAQGFSTKVYNTFGWVLPAGTPKDVVDALSASFEKMSQNADFKKKMEDAGLVVDYMGPAPMTTAWDEIESATMPLIDLAKQQQK